MPDADPRSTDAENDSFATLTIEVEPRLVDVIHSSAAMNRASLVNNAVGGYAVTMIPLGLSPGLPLPVLVLAALVGGALLTGYYAAPLIWFSTMRRGGAGLARESMTFDAHGVQYRSINAQSRRAWPFYRRARDVGNTVVLEGRIGGGTIILRNGLSAGEDAQLHQILIRKGLLDTSLASVVFRRLVAVLIGAAFALLQFNVI